MASDDIALDGGQVKIFFGTLKSKEGVLEPMKAMARIRSISVLMRARFAVRRPFSHEAVSACGAVGIMEAVRTLWTRMPRDD